MGGYNFDISSGGDWMLRTNVMAKTDLNATSLDLNANVLWNETFWFGASYRHNDAISPMLGYQSVWSGNNEDNCAVNKIKIGYAYDITTSELKNYSSGSHELFVTYCRVFCKPEPVIRYGNPRFL
jgi:type IX secretion system PorP/SprF family membrane protein